MEPHGIEKLKHALHAQGADMKVTTPATVQERLLHTLGNRLRYLRRSRHLRQFDMETLGLSYKYYQRLESGQVNPTLLTLYKVAAALNVSVSDLFRSDGENPA
jgi:DNA-binding XRE family transcriptional regulator